jgi:hypothetical protein
MIITPVTVDFPPPDQPPVLMASAAPAAAGPVGSGAVLTTPSSATGAASVARPASELAPVFNASVSYQGTTLVVDGQSYPRAPASPSRGYAPGRLLLSPQSGHPIGEVETLLTRLGLRIERALGGNPPIGWLIAVPAGFEQQWQAALMRQPAVMSVDLDGRMTIQPRTNMGPGVVR